MKIIFLLIAILLMIIMITTIKLVEGLAVPSVRVAVPSVSKHLSPSSGASRKSTGSGTGKVGRVSTAPEYTHHTSAPSTTSWNANTGQWNN
jgi:hypothetical protein